MGIEQEKGQWGPKFNLKNVGIHLSLLPNGNVLYWGRRPAKELDDPKVNTTLVSLNRTITETYILDRNTLESRLTKTEPKDLKGNQINLFCSGHCFQPDGTLLVVGGHDGKDGIGLNQACVYNWKEDLWTAVKEVSGGRWYPSLITRPDGSVLLMSGSATGDPNLVTQVWDTKEWRTLTTPEKGVFNLFPRLYLAPKNQVFIAGTLKISRFLDLNANGGLGSWSNSANSPFREAQREYAASAMYRPGKIIYISGGGGDNEVPSRTVQLIDLNDTTKTPLKWEMANTINKPRRHHFATVLPDGTVLVTGGTEAAGFNTVGPGNEVHEPELWTPSDDVKVPGTWTTMAPETDGRCYHHTALLLRNGTVLSAGSGEWDPNMVKFSLISAQIFSPPYMFKGKSPTIGNVPEEIDYRTTFTITVGANDAIAKVSWTRLGSLTHCINMNQSFSFLDFKQTGTKLEITGPVDSTYVPPGHYMLFVMSKTDKPGEAGRPAAEAPVIRLRPGGQLPAPNPTPLARRAAVEQHVGVTLNMRNEQVMAEQERPPVVVGLTPVCPYGLGPCWAGAYEALRNIKDIAVVRPKPSQEDSVAFVYLKDDILPDIDVWRKQLKEVDGGSYQMRGIELTLSGVVTSKKVGNDEQLTLAGTSTRPPVVLALFKAESKLEWDKEARATKPVTDEEAGAYTRLSKATADHPSGLKLEVTGRLQKHEAGKYSLDVKSFVVPSASA